MPIAHFLLEKHATPERPSMRLKEKDNPVVDSSIFMSRN
jgi:hypothetical protein